MTSTEKIRALAEQAARLPDDRPSPNRVCPFEAAIEPLAAARPMTAPSASGAGVFQAVGETPVQAAPAAKREGMSEEGESELREMIDAREESLSSGWKRRRLLLQAMAAAVVIGLPAVVAIKPEWRAAATQMWTHVKESQDDLKQLGSTQSYDAALEEISGHQDKIDEATAAMGIDPRGVTAEEQAQLASEINRLAGEDVGLGERAGKLQKAGTVVKALTGKEASVAEK